MGFWNRIKKKNVKQPQSQPHPDDTAEATTQQADSDDRETYLAYLDRLDAFKQLPVDQQLKQIAADTDACDKVVGSLYVQNPPTFDDRAKLANLFGHAVLLEEYAVMGQGDNEMNMIYAVGNLLIGVKYFAYWGSPLSMKQKCSVYRFSKEKAVDDLDLREIKRAILDY